ncbi:MAG TPA: XdhC family protein [Baekduia sp.]|uniref:XdhC family protein n=1 Tax=Baekduia sp. TaxID=2600305 RepID=UPI002C60A450|nr:XdhC family protein [Baekduia sp.]HMJ33502.1 XdhC family protein [Baekduia sp.]
MKDVLAQLDAWSLQARPAAVATVIATHGSAPRPIGAKMAVDARGQIAGAVSGGCVEGSVVELATQVLAGAGAQVARFGIADDEAWAVGLPCGGLIDVHVAPWDADPAGLPARFAQLARADARAALVTVVSDEDRSRAAEGRRLLVLPDGAVEGNLEDEPALAAAARAAALDLVWDERSELRSHDGAGLFVDVVAPAPRLILFGAVPVAQALCALARVAGWRPFVVDPRARFATPERIPDAERIVVAWPKEAVVELGGLDRATAVAALTHDPKIDDVALELALRSGAGVVGAMGSRGATAERRERLRHRGLSEAQIDRIAAPVGLDLGGTTDAETAISIMGELVALRNGRAGGRLSAATGTIHARPLAAAPA